MLITQANLEKHLQIDVTNEPDPVVTEYIAQAQAAAEQWCQQPLEWTAGISETFQADQTREPHHRLKRFPVTALPTVVEDSITLTVVTDFEWFEDGDLWRVVGDNDGSWTTRPRGVVVTYDAGYGAGAPAPYDTVPADLILGITMYAAELFQHGAAYAAQGPVPISSVTLEGSDTVQYAVNSQPSSETPLLGKAAKGLLAKYARRRM